MKKIRLLCAATTIYDAVKILFILSSHPKTDILQLPFSWYAAMPLLIIPLLLECMIAVDPLKYKEFAFFIFLTKLMFLMSAVYYLFDTIALYAVQIMNTNYDYDIQMLFFLLIFFIFDGILCIVFSFLGKKLKSLPTEPEGCVCK